MKYWINTISLDHVQRGVSGGFTQASHGKPHMLKRLSKDDWIIFYSPKTQYQGGDPLQSFTAIGQITDNELYQFEMSPDFIPWRRNVTFHTCSHAPIRSLIPELSFVTDTAKWGYKFRFGLFEIPQSDFTTIAHAMGVGI